MLINRKGHIPTFILFVVGLALIFVAWFVFLSSDNSISAQQQTHEQLVSTFNYDVQYLSLLFESLVQSSIDDSSSSSDFIDEFESHLAAKAIVIDELNDVSTNFFGKIRNNDYTLTEENTYTLLIEDVFVLTEVETHSLRQTRDLVISFNTTDIL